MYLAYPGDIGLSVLQLPYGMEMTAKVIKFSIFAFSVDHMID